MDDKKYIEAATRTESLLREEVILDADFLKLLDLFLDVTNLLDHYKKKIFYGRPLPEGFNIDPIIQSALDIEYPEKSFPVNPRDLHGILGIMTEAGELASALSLEALEDIPLDTVNLKEELGDLQWYEAILMDNNDWTWDEIRERNIAKLRLRYPQKFDAELADNRDLNAEREALEEKSGCGCGDSCPCKSSDRDVEYYVSESQLEVIQRLLSSITLGEVPYNPDQAQMANQLIEKSRVAAAGIGRIISEITGENK